MTLAILCRRAFSDLRQDFCAQLITTMVVSLSILIFAFFTLLYFNLQYFVDRFGTELGLTIFLTKDTPKDRIPSLHQKLIGLSEVEKVTYISSEEAFRRLEHFLKNEKDVLEGVDPQFLPPSFEIQINRAMFQLNRIRQLAGEIDKWPEVSKVQFGQEWIDRLYVFSGLVRTIVAITGILLLFTAAFVVTNTIKLTVYARQEELEIMRLVGATNMFIQGPFLVEAFLQGLLGSSLALGIVLGGYRFLQGFEAKSELFRGVSICFIPWHYTVAIIASSVLLCVIGTALAMRRFLRL
ncbi:MAG: ABC transporter permease [Deltaproteobacteria bacterium]|nr:ABC transporter permease [Deltaproteobacteria bacterium]MBW1933271.1 ABC transporter permease [Deltaproteobacteria bacterium]MBW1937987.1 ABC transporter permease [Deltaproteobacteria bacterium]MBW1965090.1 ABC transporter permease [Deltaproteobacteria bacterium]MBW2079579.1 ABC transporter permease [Deltaproteobacteria bacterium]